MKKPLLSFLLSFFIAASLTAQVTLTIGDFGTQIGGAIGSFSSASNQLMFNLGEYNSLTFSGNASIGTGFEETDSARYTYGDSFHIWLNFDTGSSVEITQFIQGTASGQLDYDTYDSLRIGSTTITGSGSFISTITIPSSATSAWVTASWDISDSALTTEFVKISGSRLSAANVSAIPEPSTYAALLGAAALAFVGWRRRRNHFC